MNEKIKTALAENPELQAYLRWGILIFSIAVSWATLKSDVKQLSHDREGDAASQHEFKASVESFMQTALQRNENQAAMYERVQHSEEEIRQMRRDMSRLIGRPQGGYYPAPPEPEPEPEWRTDPRRNP